MRLRSLVFTAVSLLVFLIPGEPSYSHPSRGTNSLLTASLSVSLYTADCIKSSTPQQVGQCRWVFKCDWTLPVDGCAYNLKLSLVGFPLVTESIPSDHGASGTTWVTWDFGEPWNCISTSKCIDNGWHADFDLIKVGDTMPSASYTRSCNHYSDCGHWSPCNQT